MYTKIILCKKTVYKRSVFENYGLLKPRKEDMSYNKEKQKRKRRKE